jgi:predicted dehydrogenase
MEFVNGAIATCHAGWSTVGRPPGIEVRVFGSRGAVRCLLSDELPGAEGLWLAGPDGHFNLVEIPSQLSAQMPETGGWAFQFPAHLIRRFVSSLTADDPAVPTFADGVRAQELLAAVLLSMEEDRWVRLPLD